MSEHWVPNEDCVPLTRARRPARRRLPVGAKVGLLIVAFTCGGTVAGLNQMFSRPDVFAEELVTVSERAEAAAAGR